jgi:glycine cleavage system transcriptional repressor
MTTKWQMLTVVGQDQPKIVSSLAGALFEGGCNLGEASMIRLGGSFTIMVMVQHEGRINLAELVRPVTEAMQLTVSVSPIEGRLHEHKLPDVAVTVSGADRAGIVALVTGFLADAGLDVLDLHSSVAGSAQAPLYVMHLEGQAARGIPALEAALEGLDLEGVEVRIRPVETLVG